MTLIDMIALFGTMAVLAAVPSVSVLAVSSRSATLGFAHGAWTALGVVIGDLVFIVLAMLGLGLLVEAMGDLFVVLKLGGGVYLIWLGIALWRSNGSHAEIGAMAASSLRTSFLMGLLITLGDQKAVFFYLILLPTFVDLGALSYADVWIVIVIAALSVGGVKLGYVYLASRAGLRFEGRTRATMDLLAAWLLIAVGVFIIIKA